MQRFDGRGFIRACSSCYMAFFDGSANEASLAESVAEDLGDLL